MKLLYVEDELDHVILAERTLEENLHQEFHLIHVETIAEALKTLDQEPDIDLVLSDLRLPDGSGLGLLKEIRARKNNPAVVLVTAQGDQEVAVAALKAGAADYLVKQTDYLHRLPVVISNAVAQNRYLREQAALQAAEIKYQSLVEQIPAVVFLEAANDTGTKIYVSPRIHELTGYTVEEWSADPTLWSSSIHPDDRKRILARDKKLDGDHVHFLEEYRVVRRDGKIIWVKEDTNLVFDSRNQPLYWQGILIDITKEKEDETALQHQLEELAVLHAASLAASNALYADQLIEHITDLIGNTLHPDNFGVLLFDERTQTLTPHASYRGTSQVDLSKPLPATQGIAGKVIMTGMPIRVGDVTTETSYIEVKGGICSELCVPILSRGQVIGVLNTESHKPHEYSERDEGLFITIANTLATAMDRLRSFEEAQHRATELEALYRASYLLTLSLEPEIIGENLIKTIEKLTDYEFASVYLLEDHSQLLVPLVIREKVQNQENYLKDKETLLREKVPVGSGIIGWVVQYGQPVRTGQVSQDDRYLAILKNVKSEMCLPLLARGKAIGILNIESTKPDAFTRQDEGLLTALANSAAIAFENARLFQEQSRRSRIIEALADIANEIATTREVLPTLDEIARRALDLLHANHVAIYLLQEDQVTLKTVTAHGTYRNELLGHTRKVGEGITGNIFINGKPEIINNTDKDSRRVIVPGTPEQEGNLESLMSAPLMLRGKPIGVINAWRAKQNGLFSETELSFLVGIAHQVSICIESGRLFQETNRQAQEAAAIAEVGRDISGTLQLDIVLERIASYAMHLLHAETSAVYLAQDSTSTLHAIAALGLDSEEIKNDPLVLGSGILGDIASQNTGEIVNDTVNDPRTVIVKGTQENPLEHIMGVPIVLKDKHTGLLAVWRSGLGTEFAPRELGFLTSLARQAAVAIENARLYNETQRRLKELEIVNHVSTSLRMAQSLDEMIPILLDETLQLVNTPHGSVWLYEHATAKLIQRNARGAETRIKHTSLNLTDGIVGHVFTSGRTHISPDLKNDEFLFKANQDSVTPGLGGVYIPIQSTAGPVGVLTIHIEKKQQVAEAINLLTILAEITGNSIHRAQLYEKSQKQVRRLTSLRDIDSAIASSFDLRLTLNILMDQTLNHLNVDAVNIGLYYPELQALSYLPGLGFTVASPTRPLIRVGEGLAGQVILKQQPLYISDLQNEPEVRNEPLLKREGFVTYIGIPLIVKGQVKGVFEVFHRTSFSPTPDWMEFLQTLAGQAAIAIDSTQLFENLQRSNQELKQAYDTTLEGWARALELRDRETEGHTRRVTDLTINLARYMGISDAEVENIHRGVLLHDIGKMGVPDNILKKTGSLNSEEWEEMRQHPVYAYNLLAPISFLRGALDIPYCHHEHWDGSGYPRGLKGEQIPLAARIFSVVDNWDALLTDRPYRKAWKEDKVIAYLKDTAGKVLDPRIVEIFLRMMEKD